MRCEEPQPISMIAEVWEGAVSVTRDNEGSGEAWVQLTSCSALPW